MINYRRHAPVLIALGTVALPLHGQSLASAKITHEPRAVPKHLFSFVGTPARSVPRAAAHQHGGSKPTSVVAVTPTRPLTGAVVRLKVRNAPPGAADYRWDLDGSGRYSTNTGRSPSVSKIYRDPGPRVITVRVTDAWGNRIGSLTLRVSAHERALRIHAPTRHARSRARGTPSRRLTRHVTPPAHAAADPAVGIVDFAFAPGSTTVHAGATITWTNHGPSSHSATANNGSFGTGVLSKGQSGSHTFTQPGSFSYFCKIHPFMHGTIVVLASTPSATLPPTRSPAPATPPAPASASALTHTTPPAAAPASSPSLPMTGLDLASTLVVGLVAAGLGIALRRVTTRS